MGTTTKATSNTGAATATSASERLQTWLVDKVNDSTVDPVPNQPAAAGQTLTFENVRIDFPLRPCMFNIGTPHVHFLISLLSFPRSCSGPNDAKCNLGCFKIF